MLTSNENEQELTNEANEKIKVAKEWFDANKLTLNAKKTRTMTIVPRGMKFDSDIRLGDNNIKRVSPEQDEKFFKFLGFRLEDTLTWEEHSKHVLNKLNTANYILATTKKQLPTEIKKLIYLGLAQSHMEYGITIWFNKKFALKASKTQKKLVRNISNATYNAHSAPLLYKQRILNPENLFELAVCRTIKKAKMKKAPSRIMNIFNPTEAHIRPQRFPNNLKLDFNAQEKRIGYEMPKIWNTLPEELKSENTSINEFINVIKGNMLEIYKEDICTNTNCHACGT